jgi:hypothetical protein
MINFEIQNHLGEVLETVSEEELATRIELAEFNYHEYDEVPENDLVTRFQTAKEEDDTLDFSRSRIYKKIIE